MWIIIFKFVKIIIMLSNYIKAEYIDGEILNIEYHKIKLILRSLNSSQTIKEAAVKCGISYRTIQNQMKNFEIVFDERSGEYIKNRNTYVKVYASV